MGIEVVDIAKRFGSVEAVRSLRLRAQPGEFLAIVGPSGCGKTTLLRVIAGLERADEGQVFIGGREATETPPQKRNVGFVFQQFALFPNMTVAENIGYGLRQRRVPRPERERRVAEMLAMIGMEGYEGRRPDQLSAGQQQRVALARALAPEPKTLLLDEPLSALDAAIRYQLRDELRRVQRQVGITTIMVTHDQEEALAVADRVAVMNEGRLEQIGTPWELYAEPRTDFVARFIGRGNFLAGRRTAQGIVLDGFGLWPAPNGTPNGVTTVATTDGAIYTTTGTTTSSLTDATMSGTGDEVVTVLVRPESIVIADERPEDVSDRFVVPAVVEDLRFGGERAHVLLHPIDTAVPSLLNLIAAIPSGEVPRLTQRVNERVYAVIPHAALHVLP